MNGKHVVMLGAGLVGSHGAVQIARIPDVRRMTIVDHDHYEHHNLAVQDVAARDVGKAKATVTARKLRMMKEHLDVRAYVDEVKNVPPGLLNGDVIVSGLDSLKARRYASEVAWSLGRPFVDTGVRGKSMLLVRVNVYVPTADSACYVCAFDEGTYARLEQRFPCRGDAPATWPTSSPSFLGGLAGSLAAAQVDKLLKGNAEAFVPSKQILMDVQENKLHVTNYLKNSSCRFGHGVWTLKGLPGRPPRLITLGEALSLGEEQVSLAGNPAGPSLQFEGGAKFATRLSCSACPYEKEILRLSHRLTKRQRVCPQCNRELVAAGFYLRERLSASQVTEPQLQRSLAALGARPGDIFSVTGSGESRHFELPGTLSGDNHD